MAFAGVSYLAVFIAGVAGWLVGAAWYMALGKQWMAAQGKTEEQCKQEYEAKKGTPAAYAPFVLAFVGALIMAWVLAGHMTVKDAIESLLTRPFKAEG